MVKLKTIKILEAALALEVIATAMNVVPAEQKFQLCKVQAVLQQSIEIAQQCAENDEQKDKWLEEAETLPFQPLVKAELFKHFTQLKPSEFLALKRICQ